MGGGGKLRSMVICYSVVKTLDKLFCSSLVIDNVNTNTNPNNYNDNDNEPTITITIII